MTQIDKEKTIKSLKEAIDWFNITEHNPGAAAALYAVKLAICKGEFDTEPEPKTHCDHPLKYLVLRDISFTREFDEFEIEPGHFIKSPHNPKFTATITCTKCGSHLKTPIRYERYSSKEIDRL